MHAEVGIDDGAVMIGGGTTEFHTQGRISLFGTAAAVSQHEEMSDALGIWSLSGHGGHRSSRTDQARLTSARPDPLEARLTCKHAGRAQPAAAGLPVGFRGFPRSASFQAEPTHLGERLNELWVGLHCCFRRI